MLETPGHTPESISILVYDLAVSGTSPHAVLTGDTLFVGDVGRPDLRASLGWSAAKLGDMLFDSLHRKLLPLPDSSLVYPAHGAGSLCGKALSKELSSTIGEQRRSNYALQPMSKAAFVDLVTTDQPDAPPYFTYDAVLNSRERQTLDEALSRELTPLDLESVLQAAASGAQLLDTRDAVAFGAAHLRGSINIGLGGQYATWAGTDPESRGADRHHHRPGRGGGIGAPARSNRFRSRDGYLKDGLAAVQSRPDLIVSTERAEPGAGAGADIGCPGGGGGRSHAAERAQKWIEGSLHVPLNHLAERVTELPTGRPLLVFCAGGYRSSIGASLLTRAGASSSRRWEQDRGIGLSPPVMGKTTRPTFEVRLE